MNALAILEIGTLTPATVFAPGGVQALIAKVEAEVRATPQDISTDEGREAVKSLAYKIARSKTALDEMGKELVSGIKAQAATIDAERRIVRERLDALKDEVRGPLTKWEAEEAARVQGHENALVFIATSDKFPSPPSVAMLRERIAAVADYATRYWQEFRARADVAIPEALHKLNDMRATAEQYERDQAELIELRRIKAERDARDQAEAQARAVAAAREKAQAEAAEKAAERDRQHAAQIEREQAEREAREKARAEQAEKDKAAAVAKAIENENRRIQEAHAASEAARLKREQNARHRNKVHREITEALFQAGFSADTAATLIGIIDAGNVPHVSITY